MPTHDHYDSEHIQIDVDPLLADVDLDNDMTLQLPAWQWVALDKIADHHQLPMSNIVQHWIGDRLELITGEQAHEAASDRG